MQGSQTETQEVFPQYKAKPFNSKHDHALALFPQRTCGVLGNAQKLSVLGLGQRGSG